MRIGELLAGLACAAACLAIVLVVAGRRRPADRVDSLVAAPPSTWRVRWDRTVGAALAAARPPGHTRRQQHRRLVGWGAVGLVVWVVTGWPVAGAGLVAVMVWRPWLLGAGRVAAQRIDRLEALEKWCRRMADTLTGGGAVGLAQAVTLTARHADETIAPAVRGLAFDLRDGRTDIAAGLRTFADALDDRVADTVAAALLLALHQQSVGVAEVLRQLAEGVARDVRARRDIEAARAESRQSIKTLLLIQFALLGMLALVPGFAAPYTSGGGQVVMAVLLVATVAVLVWMRQLAIGRPAPRFLGRLSPRSAADPHPSDRTSRSRS